MKRLAEVLAVSLICSVAAFAQHGHEGGAPAGGPANHESHAMPNQGGHIPAHGPAPVKRGPAQPSRIEHADQPGHPVAPHVHANDVWVGHNTGRRDANYHLDHPWAHGHFPGEIGRNHIWRLGGGGPSRFWFGGFYFNVVDYDLAYCDGWDWNSDDIVLYDDPDHVGFYLAYNVRLGVYVHVLYQGQ